MIFQGTYSWQQLAIFSVLSFALAVLLLCHFGLREGIPRRSDLERAEGRIAFYEEHKYGTRFRLAGMAEVFDYPSKAGALDAVRRALGKAGDAVVAVDYAPDTFGPRNSDRRYHLVWSLEVGDKSIRTFEETAAEWEQGNRLGLWLGIAFIASGAWFAGYARRTKSRA